MEIDTRSMNLKRIGLELCTCTWIEIMTRVGVDHFELSQWLVFPAFEK